MRKLPCSPFCHVRIQENNSLLSRRDFLLEPNHADTTDPGLLGSRLPHMTAIRVLPSSFVEQPPLKRSGAEVSSAFSSFNLHQVSSLPESLVQRLELLRITCFLYVWVSLPLLKGRWTLAFLFINIMIFIWFSFLSNIGTRYNFSIPHKKHNLCLPGIVET